MRLRLTLILRSLHISQACTLRGDLVRASLDRWCRLVPLIDGDESIAVGAADRMYFGVCGVKETLEAVSLVAVLQYSAVQSSALLPRVAAV